MAAPNRRAAGRRRIAFAPVLIVLIAIAWVALVALGLSLCRLAARSDEADAESVASWLGTVEVEETQPPGEGDVIEVQRTRAIRGL